MQMKTKELVNGAPTPELLDEVVRRVVDVARPERIIMFGSAARNTMTGDSDIDLLVVKGGSRKRALAAEIMSALRGLHQAFDIIVASPDDVERYGDSPGLVFREALRNGRTLYVA
jgi:uncharacterized protein